MVGRPICVNLVGSSSHKIICCNILCDSLCTELSGAADILMYMCMVRFLMEKILYSYISLNEHFDFLFTEILSGAWSCFRFRCIGY